MTGSSKFLASIAAPALLACLLLPTPAHACSKAPVTVQRWTRNTINFIGTALADTLRAGPGDITFVVAGGHFGPASNRIIFGQKISVEQLSATEQKLLPPGVHEVVLIPWDYDPACRPTPWARSARWVAAGTRGIYNATLRARAHWLNGVPTLDVMSPNFIPYRGSAPQRDSSLPTSLSIDELFAITPLLPDPDLLDTDAEAATAPLLAWAKANPEVANRPPAKSLVWDATYSVFSTQMSRVKPDIGGTWRFIVDIPGNPSREFFARNNERPTSPWSSTYPPPARQPWEVAKLEGYSILTTVHTELSKLPQSCATRGAESYMAQRTAVQRTADGAFSIPGHLELGLVNAAFRGDTDFKAFKSAPVLPKTKTSVMDEALRAKTLFESGGDGIMRVLQSYQLDDGRTLTLRGERISNEVVRCAW